MLPSAAPVVFHWITGLPQKSRLFQAPRWLERDICWCAKDRSNWSENGQKQRSLWRANILRPHLVSTPALSLCSPYRWQVCKSSEHYGSWRIDQRLGAGSRQTFCNGPHWDYHPINGDRGLDASKLHPKSKIWKDALAKMHEARLLMECIHICRGVTKRRLSFAWRRYRIDWWAK